MSWSTICGDILLIACIFPHPCRAQKNTTRHVKYLVYCLPNTPDAYKIRSCKLVIVNLWSVPWHVICVFWESWFMGWVTIFIWHRWLNACWWWMHAQLNLSHSISLKMCENLSFRKNGSWFMIRTPPPLQLHAVLFLLQHFKMAYKSDEPLLAQNFQSLSLVLGFGRKGLKFYATLFPNIYPLKCTWPQNIFYANINLCTYLKTFRHYLQFLTFLWASKLTTN